MRQSNFFDKTEGYRSYLEKRYGIKIRIDITAEMLGNPTNCCILDIGCGDGAISLQFADESNYITLVDTSKKMLDLARSNTPSWFSKIKYLNDDFLQLNFYQTFDIIILIGVLSHLPSNEGVFRKIFTLLKPGGRCIIQFTDADKIISKINLLYYHILDILRKNLYGYSIKRYSFNEILSELQETGFTVNDLRRYSLVLPGMGRLPDSFLYNFQKLSLEKSWLSKHGSEVILLVSMDQS